MTDTDPPKPIRWPWFPRLTGMVAFLTMCLAITIWAFGSDLFVIPVAFFAGWSTSEILARRSK